MKSRRTKRMQRDATAVSIVRSGRKVGSFAERQQLAEGAPLMRKPFCGRAGSISPELSSTSDPPTRGS